METFVTACHRYAKRPGKPDLASWQESFDRMLQEEERAAAQRLWVGSVPPLADAYRPRINGIDLGSGGRTFVLTGLGGVGKTQIAAGLAHHSWSKHQVDLVLWVTAASRENIITRFAEAARQLGVAEDRDPVAGAERFLSWLAERHGRRWLIVLDDLGDPAYLRGLWPDGDCVTVVTTRRQESVLAGGNRIVVPVRPFTPAEAVAYLGEKLGFDGARLDRADTLAEELGYLPLALAQAAAYIVDHQLDCGRYLKRLRERRLEDIEPGPEAWPDDHTAAVASAWKISIEKANELKPAGVARPVLEILALLDPNGAPASIFATRAVRRLLAERRGRGTPADDAMDGLACLQRLSLCTLAPDGTVRVHQLLQRAVRESASERMAELAVCAADALLESWSEDGLDPSTIHLLRGNTEALMRHAEDALWGADLHQVVFEAGNSLGRDGLNTAAIEYWVRLRPIAAERLGPEHPDTLTVRNNLAWSYGRAGDARRALTELRELLPIRRRVLGEDHQNTLATEHGIAFWLGKTGDSAGAVDLLGEVLTKYRRVLGAGDRDTLNTRLGLASLRGMTESAGVAVVELQELLGDYRRELGRDHPETLDVEIELVGWQVAAGAIGEALGRMERLLRDHQRVLGPEHTDTLWARYLTADLRATAGHRAEAAAELQVLQDDVIRLLEQGRPEVDAIRREIERWSQAGGEDAG